MSDCVSPKDPKYRSTGLLITPENELQDEVATHGQHEEVLAGVF